VRAALALAVLGLVGRCAKAEPEAAPAPTSPMPSARVSAMDPPRADGLELVALLPSADVAHDGVFLDVGTRAVDPRRDHSVGPFDDVQDEDRAGATFGRLRSRRVAYDFALLEPMPGATVSLRVVGNVSRQVSVYMDDRRIGVAALSRDEPGIVAVPAADLAAGPHVLTLRFGGMAQGADDSFASIDWIRIGPKEESPKSYAPPTLGDVVTDVILGGVPERAIVLRPASTVRFHVHVAKGMSLRMRLGYWGTGRGTAVLRLVEDGEAPRLLASEVVVGEAGSTWKPIVVDLTPYAGHVVGLELTAADASGGGRVAFGEPVIETDSAGAHAETPASPAVVVIVAAGLDRRMIPPWGPIDGLPAIGRLARDGVTFDRYHAETTMIGPVMASLLSGLPPKAHGVEGPQARLVDDVRLLGERAKESSAHSAFFTGVPSTFPAFGFDRGWDRTEAISPVKDSPAIEPCTLGAGFIKEQAALGGDDKFVLVVHTRGGHPPWDVSKDEVATLPPEEYSGPLEPRAGAIVLANLRALKQRGPGERLTGDDWRRLRALESTALRGQDGGVRRILDTLEHEGLYDKSLIVFMGDVATGDPPMIPFPPIAPLREDILLAPLIVKFPGNLLAGKRADAFVSTTDVTATLIHALGADAERTVGVDLLRMAKGDLPPDGHPLVATLGARYATRWGPWLLSGEYGRRPSLCRMDVDPACTSDVYEQSPLAAEALWRATYSAETRAKALRVAPPGASSIAGLDADTQAALKVFGY
jgi:hypothetical protein